MVLVLVLAIFFLSAPSWLSPSSASSSSPASSSASSLLFSSSLGFPWWPVFVLLCCLRLPRFLRWVFEGLLFALRSFLLLSGVRRLVSLPYLGGRWCGAHIHRGFYWGAAFVESMYNQLRICMYGEGGSLVGRLYGLRTSSASAGAC